MSKLKSLLSKAAKIKEQKVGKLADYSYSKYKKLKKSVKYHLGSGEYGKRMNQKYKASLEKALENEDDEARKEQLRKMLEKYK